MKRTLGKIVLCAPLLMPTFSHATTLMPNVLEMFTSKTCPSCPNADRNLTEMAKKDGRLALSYHVNIYKNRKLKDPFILVENNLRQKKYNALQNTNVRYTPHFVMNGEYHMNGGNSFKTKWHLLRHEKSEEEISNIHLTEARDGYTLFLGETDKINLAQDLWRVTYRTDNSSHKINTVTSIERLGVWKGGEAFVPVQKAGKNEAVAILIQAQNQGPIYTAVLP
ncbi:MAG: DUF1223 domain-containing protein [Pseudomonadota bacterium]|nr:DUF1223 domain-containing protein [Pseudomonadota bacterium]